MVNSRSSKSNLAARWTELIKPVEPFLRAVSAKLEQEAHSFEKEIVEYVHYAISSQGKQIRPTLVALSANSQDGENENLVRVAVIIEMVHLATLIHDDILDHAQIRRNRPTLALKCGTSTSVLLGDALFAHALTLAAQFPTPEICQAVASSAKIVCTGEILQTEGHYGLGLSRSQYIRILQMKTAELFALSCELGARLRGASYIEQSAFRKYGLALGIAYQLYDDCIDLYGEEEEVGKSVGVDLACGKLTLPVLLLIEHKGEDVKRLLEQRIKDWQPRYLIELRQLLSEAGIAYQCWLIIKTFCEKASMALDDVPETLGVSILRKISQLLANEAQELLLSR